MSKQSLQATLDSHLASNDDSDKFDKYDSLPPNLVPTSKQVMKFSDTYVSYIKESKSFKLDWGSFLEAIKKYKGDKLTFDLVKENTINQEQATVSTMVDKITKFLVDTLSVVLSAKEKIALATNIETTFTDLKTAKSKGWADFSKDEHSSNTSWEYRLLFSHPNSRLPTDFYSLVTTIMLEADIHEEESWWGIKSSTSKNFSAAITAMELVVTEGFVNPS